VSYCPYRKEVEAKLVDKADRGKRSSSGETQTPSPARPDRTGEKRIKGKEVGIESSLSKETQGGTLNPRRVADLEVFKGREGILINGTRFTRREGHKQEQKLPPVANQPWTSTEGRNNFRHRRDTTPAP